MLSLMFQSLLDEEVPLLSPVSPPEFGLLYRRPLLLYESHGKVQDRVHLDRFLLALEGPACEIAEVLCATAGCKVFFQFLLQFLVSRLRFFFFQILLNNFFVLS